MRTLIGVAIIAFAACGWASPPKHFVDLDRPGALDAIERDNPEHYRKIVEILRISQAEPCETLPMILKAQFDADITGCKTFLLMTSEPPKRHVSFTLGDTDYATNAVQTKLGGHLIPAK